MDSSDGCPKVVGMTGGTAAAVTNLAGKTAAVFPQVIDSAKGVGKKVNEGCYSANVDCGGDGNGGGDGFHNHTGGGGGRGEESNEGGASEVAALRERVAAAAAAAEVAAKEKNRLKAEINDIKGRLASVEQQLRCARVTVQWN